MSARRVLTWVDDEVEGYRRLPGWKSRPDVNDARVERWADGRWAVTAAKKGAASG